MPNRLVNTDLWNDENIVENFTAEDKYFWLYLLTSPHNNMCGVFKNSPALIARDMGLHKDTIVNLIYRFANNHKLIYCDDGTNEIMILNWYKYNWSKSSKILNLLEKEQETIKSEEINRLLEERKAIIFLGENDTLSIPYQYPPISNTISNTNTISNNNIYNNYNFSDRIKEYIDKWLCYKKERKQSYKETGLKTLLNSIQRAVEENGEEYVISGIENSMANNWQGIYYKKEFSKKELPKTETDREFLIRKQYSEEYVDSLTSEELKAKAKRLRGD